MSADLFGKAQPVAPLADALRPKSLDEVVGQEHLIGPGKPLRLAFESGRPHSMILWGPPGSGKTTIARLLNAVENLKNTGHQPIDGAFVEQTLAKNLRRFDKGGEQFYDQISALHKAVRGSDADASLYWMVRMLDGGADPLYIGRRVVRMAIEDIGLADPQRLRVALDACETYERLGSPEGELALAEAVIYLAVAAKSNAIYEAYNSARAFVAGDGTRPVPLHLRNAPTRLMKQLGYGKGYRYAHDEEDAYAAGESYLPEGMGALDWYRPTDRGLEAKIREKLAELRRRNEQARKQGE